jgi:flavorubredoxin
MGQTLTVLGRRFRFLDPPLADRSHTTWIYDLDSRVMFVADGFGNYHAPDECHLLSSDLPTAGRARNIHEFHQDTLTWLRYVDPQVMNRVLRRLFDEQAVSFVAPIHGNPISAKDLDSYLAHLEESVARIAREYRVT